MATIKSQSPQFGSMFSTRENAERVIMIPVSIPSIRVNVFNALLFHNLNHHSQSQSPQFG
ncbi:hypothetical protein D1AOALGA4SA_11173 [Olavius algarvensis Delta 1 endosymbiont]|nr:hypothetical protein D1AOALGA4SA_11173 [Olavius algarvensis Delta 1 endosymbiont]